MCDLPSIRRSIRSTNRSIRSIDRQINKLEKSRTKMLAKWERGLASIDERIQKISDALNKPKQRDLDSIETYIQKKKDAVEAEFAPKLANLNSQCSKRQQRFDEALAPLMTKLQLNIDLRNKLQQDYNNAPNDQKITYRQRLVAQDTYVKNLEAQIASGQAIHNSNMRGCSSSDAGSVGAQKAAALAYWDNIKQNAINYVNNKYGSVDNSPLLNNAQKAKQSVMDKINEINAGYDARISQHNAEKAYYQTTMNSLQNTLRACLDNRSGDCGPIAIPICLEGYELVSTNAGGNCPEYECLPID